MADACFFGSHTYGRAGTLRFFAAPEEAADDLDDNEDDEVIHHVHLVGVDSGEHHEQGVSLLQGQHGP